MRHRTAGGVFAALFAASAALAQSGGGRGQVVVANTDKDNHYDVTILVSNEEDDAATPADPLLKNGWGIAAGGTTGPWWVNDNDTNFSTLYEGDGTKRSLEVAVPGGPTGIVFNGGSSFQLTEGVPALFIFDALDGTFSAWAGGTAATVVHSEEGAVYTGLAIHGDTLYAADFAGCSVDAYHGNFFDDSFDEFDTAGGFEDHTILGGYCPFGIQAVGDSIFVTYAKVGEDGDEERGVGLGFVREFDANGNLISRVGNRGQLNAPWGVAMAPDNFGRFSNCLLVGNFGDGHINAFCKTPSGNWHRDGRLREGVHVLTIDGLWGIGFGNGGAAGDPNVLYFAAGPDAEENGYYGKIEFAPRN
jgi:uncharacterized protein (TIGR03118 family)